MTFQETKAKLISQGFYVEDMGQEYGAEFAGEYRWMNSVTNDFQDHDTSESEEAAWIECVKHIEENAE